MKKEIEVCDWEEAIEIGGFYFERAKYLDLPKPPKCFVYDEDFNTLSENEQKAVSVYHTKFKNAEAEKATKKMF